MVTPLSYVLAKTILVFPWFFIFALFAHGIPFYLVQDAPGEAFVIELILYAAVMFVFESVAETLSVWFDDPVRLKNWDLASCSSFDKVTHHVIASDSWNVTIHELLVRISRIGKWLAWSHCKLTNCCFIYSFIYSQVRLLCLWRLPHPTARLVLAF